jgi:ATP-dependent Zn protease
MKTKDYSKMTVEELRAETIRLVGDRHYVIQEFIKERPDDLDHLADAVLDIDDELEKVKHEILNKQNIK